MPASLLIEATPNGLYCPIGDFHIDPWKPVDRALISHAHSDHAYYGSREYLCSKRGEDILRLRLGEDATISSIEYGERIEINGVSVSFHPAGHILGSSQIRVEHQGEVWVFSGDYKLEKDRTCEQFEPLKCHTFITESTFGLPIYSWQKEQLIFEEINAWWKENASEGKASLITAYPLGKSQRVMAGLDASIGPIYTHGAVERICQEYRSCGVKLPKTKLAAIQPKTTDWSNALIVAPPSAHATPWSRRFGDLSSSFVSGWMQIRGARRRRAVDKGFALSDHADWQGLLSAIKETGAWRVFVTHGYSGVLARHLTSSGYKAEALTTRFEGELDSSEDMVEDAS